MAFNNVQPASGPFYLAPGASTRIYLWFGRVGDDRGAQWIMAHPLRGEPPCELVLSDFAKSIDYEIGTVTINGPAQYGYEPSSAYWRYHVTVRNTGSRGVRFNVQGGGNA
jgi:hypothetical protein